MSNIIGDRVSYDLSSCPVSDLLKSFNRWVWQICENESINFVEKDSVSILIVSKSLAISLYLLVKIKQLFSLDNCLQIFSKVLRRSSRVFRWLSKKLLISVCCSVIIWSCASVVRRFMSIWLIIASISVRQVMQCNSRCSIQLSTKSMQRKISSNRKDEFYSQDKFATRTKGERRIYAIRIELASISCAWMHRDHWANDKLKQENNYLLINFKMILKVFSMQQRNFFLEDTFRLVNYDRFYQKSSINRCYLIDQIFKMNSHEKHE